jgi:hypothetical protein
VYFNVSIPQALVRHRTDVFDAEYRALLMESVFPAAGEMETERLIDNFHVLLHSGVDLRLSVSDLSRNPSIKGVLAKYGLPQALEPWDEAGHSAKEYRLLRMS